MKTEYYREGCIIKSVAKKEDGNPEDMTIHGSISKAKKKSHIMQMQNGGLGRGYLKVIRNDLSKKKAKSIEQLQMNL